MDDGFEAVSRLGSLELRTGFMLFFHVYITNVLL